MANDASHSASNNLTQSLAAGNRLFGRIRKDAGHPAVHHGKEVGAEAAQKTIDVALLELVERGKPGLATDSCKGIGLRQAPIVIYGGGACLQGHFPLTRLQSVGRLVLLGYKPVAYGTPIRSAAKRSAFAPSEQIEKVLPLPAEGSHERFDFGAMPRKAVGIN